MGHEIELDEEESCALGINLDHNVARARLHAAIALAQSDQLVPDEWVKRALIVGESPARTYTPMLGTALLARASDDRVDALALKETSGDYAYSARGLAHDVLVPASVKYRFDIRTTGREPLNNQPFFRYDRVDLAERVRYRDDYRYLVECLELANLLSKDEALHALAAFLRVCIERAQSAVHASLKGVAVGLRASIDAARELVSEAVEGGKRAQALVAASFDVVYGQDRVQSYLVNDPSRHFPGDVLALDGAGHPLVCAEVRAKPVVATEIAQFARALAESGITRGLVVALAPNQPMLAIAEIVDEIARERGVLITVTESVDDLLLSSFAWSTKPLSDLLSEFPLRVSERLQGINAEAATIREWAELVQALKLANPIIAPASGKNDLR